MRFILVSLLACSLLPLAAQYNGPESVEFDAIGDRYFVSNTGDNSIKQRAQDGTVTAFASGLSTAPYGLELQGDTLFACMSGNVRGYRTSDGVEVFNISVGGSFLNGIASDGHFIYVTDFSATKIFKVDPAANSFTTLVSSTSGTPNGIKYDPVLDKLWVAFWGSNAKIKSYDKSTGAQLSTFTTNVGSIDGITLDCLGRILISSWSPNRVTRYENTFTLPAVDLGVPGLNHPADICFDPVHNRVCIPNAGNNTVTLFDLTDCNTAIIEAPGYTTINAFPNPTDGLLRLDVDFFGTQPFIVYNDRGLLVASGTLSPGALLSIQSLPSGLYVIDLPRVKRYVRVVKK